MTKHDNVVSVGLYLHGDALDPAEITAILGVEPSDGWRKGERKITATGKEIIRKTGRWALIVHPESDRPEDGLAALMARLPSHGRQYLQLPNVEGGLVSIFITSDAAEDGGGGNGFSLDPEYLRYLAAVDLPLTVNLFLTKD